MSSALSGFGLGLSLIVAIGAQNAFVLRQGLRREHVFAICLLCSCADALLYAVGVTGFSAVERAVPQITPILLWGGAAFLLVYAFRSFRAALGPAERLVPQEGAGATSRRSALSTAAALTFLNPGVYLDTLVFAGTVSTHVPSPAAFALGASLASFLFFFALGYGARWMRPLFARPRSWLVLEIAIGCIMTALAVKLVLTT